jgi:hypothetical protein
LCVSWFAAANPLALYTVNVKPSVESEAESVTALSFVPSILMFVGSTDEARTGVLNVITNSASPVATIEVAVKLGIAATV